MPYTTPHTITVGELVTVDTMNDEWGGNVAFLANPPACRAYNNAAISIANAAWTSLTLNSERHDTDSLHSTTVNTSRMTINTAGLYVLTGTVEFASNATGIRGLQFLWGGSIPLAIHHQPANPGGIVTAVTIATVYPLAVGNYVELQAFQNSGGALNANAIVSYTPEFSATWIGRG